MDPAQRRATNPPDFLVKLLTMVRPGVPRRWRSRRPSPHEYGRVALKFHDNRLVLGAFAFVISVHCVRGSSVNSIVDDKLSVEANVSNYIPIIS